MSRKSVYAALSGSGIPIVHMAWPLDGAPELPWAVYYLYEDTKLNADNIRWVSHNRWCVELYQQVANTEVEEQIESTINNSFGDYNKNETWIESENCLMTTYIFTEIERNEDNG